MLIPIARWRWAPLTAQRAQFAFLGFEELLEFPLAALVMIRLNPAFQAYDALLNNPAVLTPIAHWSSEGNLRHRSARQCDNGGG